VLKIFVACYGLNHSFLIFSSHPYLLLLPKSKATGTSHSSPSLSFSVLPPLRASDHGRQRGQHRVFHGGADVADGILVVYRDKHQHRPPRQDEGQRQRSCRVTFFLSRSSNLPMQLAPSRSPNSPYRPPVSASSVFSLLHRHHRQ
jgi:hypothetical protein